MLAAFCCMSLHSQRYNNNLDIDDVKESADYYWGQSRVYSNPVSGADEEAMDALYRNIAENCNPSAIYPDSEADFDYKDHLLKIVSTLAGSLSEKTEYVEVENKNQYCYFVCIKKELFDKMCDDRKSMIQKLADDGLGYERNHAHQLQTALQNYYWGMIMCYAHPHGKTLTINVDGKQENAFNWFDKKIDGDEGILKDFVFYIDKKNPGIVKDDCLLLNLRLRTKYGDETPISNVNINFNDGRYRQDVTITDGRSEIRLYDKTADNLRIRLNYEFKYKNTNSDVLRVYNILKPRFYFDNALYEVKIPDVFNEKKTDTKVAMPVVKEIEKAFRDKNHYSVKNYFTLDAFAMLDTLMNYGDYEVLEQQTYDTIHFGDMIIFRGIKMEFRFDGVPPFQKEVVLRIDKNTQKITSLAFRLSAVAERDIDNNKRWSRRSRLMLVNFLEDYQTAYALKRIDYLESIFSEDALIVVGHVVKKTQIPDEYKLPVNIPNIELHRKTKTEYMSHLRNVFNKQKYIHINFTKTEFTKKMKSSASLRDNNKGESNHDDIFGVQILQEYYSSYYGDTGYLFLLVDLRTEHPMIHVRAWQPDTLGLQLDSLFGLRNIVEK